jgi:hypothetical protein
MLKDQTAALIILSVIRERRMKMTGREKAKRKASVEALRD